MIPMAHRSPQPKRHGVAVTSLGVSTKLLSVGPG